VLFNRTKIKTLMFELSLILMGFHERKTKLNKKIKDIILSYKQMLPSQKIPLIKHIYWKPLKCFR